MIEQSRRSVRNADRAGWHPVVQKGVLILLGVLLACVLLELALRIGGWMFLTLQETRNRFSLRQGGAYRVLCLGESTTANQYPRFLEEALNSPPTLGATFSVIDKGVPGTSTSSIVQQLETDLDRDQPDIVVTMMGINDQLRLGASSAPPPNVLGGVASLKLYKVSRWLRESLTAVGNDAGRFTVDRRTMSAPPHSEGALLSDEAFVGLGRVALRQIRLSEAQRYFEAALALNPRSDKAFVGLGKLACDRGQHKEAEDFYHTALALNPYNTGAFIGLGRIAFMRNRYEEAEDCYRAVLTINPKNDAAFSDLGQLAFVEGRYKEAGTLYHIAMELNADNFYTRMRLGAVYLFEGRLAMAEQLLASGPRSEVDNRLLTRIYEDMGNLRLAQAYRERVNDGYPPQTRLNYLRLKQILDRRRIVYVCAQYPMRSVAPLKALLAGAGRTLFVDNDQSFREAVVREGYRAYFRDIFAGDFGHCTEKGNRLLAQQIAQVILDEVQGSLRRDSHQRSVSHHGDS